MIKKIIVVLAVVLVFPCIALAELNTDVRLKLGGAAGASSLDFSGYPSIDGSGSSGKNIQVEVVLSPTQDSPAGFVIGVGAFNRTHSGNFDSAPLNLDYKATGFSIAPGVGFKVNENLHFEGRLELDYSPSGTVSLSSPGVVFNETQSGVYTSSSLIGGIYYTFYKPGFQLGFELGFQSFEGDFKIWNNSGYWTDGKVKGSGAIANLAFGVRF
jgi:hypothetical protein